MIEGRIELVQKCAPKRVHLPDLQWMPLLSYSVRILGIPESPWQGRLDTHAFMLFSLSLTEGDYRDVTIGETEATTVAPKFLYTLTLFQPGEQILPQHRRGCTKNFPTAQIIT